MASSAGSSKDSGKASSRHHHDRTIKLFDAKFIMQIHVTAALMENLEATRLLPLTEDARERMEALLDDLQKGRCRTTMGMKSLAFDMEQNIFPLKIMLDEDGNYTLTAPWETIAGNCQVSPGAVVSIWGYQAGESFGFPLVLFFFRLDGTAEENEPLPSYEPPDSDGD